ncbi:phosphatidate cytidylyltransferase [Caproiciproducens faecalis]|uniref:Phosphatidate cytidylyltransferase n=1 Tax=Caproiciproducens faecalis TaxID=2820301 RepID=A0ABS7DSD4_9FIRM|nr:phosphatidate cytidylyltransferase [Caproiciproducens faecalis]MBW7573725.1 phosphatidate cytidylyltransferase [Caproiciproducens faecalis]
MKERVASGVSLVLFLAAIVVFNSTIPAALNIAIALISVLAVFEIISALGLSKNFVLLVPSLIFSAVIPLMQLVTPQQLQVDMLQQTAYFLYTVVIFGALILYHQVITFREVGVIYSMSLMIPTALETIISLRNFGGKHGMFYVIIAIFSAWIADTGAFFAGSRWGKHKLCPNISPKKTVEGVIGGFILNIVAMIVFGYIFHAIYYAYKVEISYLTLVVIGFFGTIMSILGDLSFSLIKRSCHIKDFGEIIPGHGGILDRFDSVIFEAPFVYLLVQFMPLVFQ